NDANGATYQYGTYLKDTIFEMNFGENWYYQIQTANNGYGALSTAAKLRRQNLPTVVAPTYGTAVTIDVGQGDTFDITASNTTAFTINNPEVATVTGLTIDP